MYQGREEQRRKVGGHGNEVWHDKHTYIRIIILDINFVLWLFFFLFLSLSPSNFNLVTLGF